MPEWVSYTVLTGRASGEGGRMLFATATWENPLGFVRDLWEGSQRRDTAAFRVNPGTVVAHDCML
jgi:hypothetical protein